VSSTPDLRGSSANEGSEDESYWERELENLEEEEQEAQVSLSLSDLSFCLMTGSQEREANEGDTLNRHFTLKNGCNTVEELPTDRNKVNLFNAKYAWLICSRSAELKNNNRTILLRSTNNREISLLNPMKPSVTSKWLTKE